MADVSFSQLKSTILRLKKERDEVMNELLHDRQQASLIENEMIRLKREIEYHSNLAKEHDRNANEYNRVIEESEKTYSKVSTSVKSLIMHRFWIIPRNLLKHLTMKAII
jgi:uncharacterized coiled-coil DUF342 family protein